MNIGVVGLGLIGGSLGFDLRCQGHPVVGVSRQPDTCKRAVELGIVDEAGTEIERLTPCDVVFLCTPLHHLIPTAHRLAPVLSPDAIVTDVGSAKASIVAALEPIFPRFVGGHPMAGKAERGIEVAQQGLFAGNPYVLTPTPITDPQAMTLLQDLIQQLQARYYCCTPQEHDRAVAWISHLPVMVSASLIQACLQEPESGVQHLAQQLASSGFRDTSRVGGGAPELGRLMAQYNTPALLQSLYHYRHVLNDVIATIEGEQWEALEETLKETEQTRPRFL